MDDEREPGSRGPVEQRLHRPDRLVMLTDGIFAIAMTLLALEIQVPEDVTDEARFGAEMGTFFGSLGVFVVAFSITAQYWSGSHRALSYVHTVDRRSLSLGVTSLLGIAALPAAARLITGVADHWQSVVTAAAILAVTSLLTTRFYASVLRPELAEISADDRRRILVAPLVNVTVYLLTIVAALVLHKLGGPPGAAFALWFLLPLNTTVSRLLSRRRAPAPSRSSG